MQFAFAAGFSEAEVGVIVGDAGFVSDYDAGVQV